MALEVIWWEEDAVGYVDQRLLPHELVRARAGSVDEVVSAIATLAVRGAPCIGVFAAYGVALAARVTGGAWGDFEAATARIRGARPTAVNLAWAVDRVLAAPNGAFLDEAHAIAEEQRAVDRALCEHGAALMPDAGAVLTHCNTGPLATAGEGSALGVIVAAHRKGKRLQVYVDETRPLLQGARLTTFELAAAGVPATLIVDGAAAATMRAKDVKAVVVGADRITRNGDVANKIGTYQVAVAAAHHGIPFYVAAPRSTIDFALQSGAEIAIEERGADEVRAFGGVPVAPRDVAVYNPAFDVTPNHLVSAIVTEYGISRAPYVDTLPDLEGRPALGLLARIAAGAKA